MTSNELIRCYLSERSETAFAELVRQHVLAPATDGGMARLFCQAELPLVIAENSSDGVVDVGEVMLRPTP